MNKQEVIVENPLVKDLLDQAEGAVIVQIDGFVGPSNDSKYVRIYRDLTLSTCVDVPRKDVIQSVSPDNCQPTDSSATFVKGTAEVKCITKTRVSDTGTITMVVNLRVDEIERSTDTVRVPEDRGCSCNSETVSQLRQQGNGPGLQFPPMDCEIRCELGESLCGDSWWCWLDRWLCDYYCRNPRTSGGLTIGI